MSKNQTVQALETAGLTMIATMTNDPIPEGFASGSHTWKVLLKYKGRRMTLPFFTGSAIGEVSIADVVSCLISDLNASENNTFESFCSDFGYDTDSRAALATFKACERSGRRIKQLLGDDLDKVSELVQDY